MQVTEHPLFRVNILLKIEKTEVSNKELRYPRAVWTIVATCLR